MGPQPELSRVTVPYTSMAVSSHPVQQVQVSTALKEHIPQHIIYLDTHPTTPRHAIRSQRALLGSVYGLVPWLV